MIEGTSEPLAVVVGRNFRRIRTDAGVTQDRMAKHARMTGLRWTASKVGDFESGRANPTFATVLAASYALSSATNTDVTLTDLVASGGFVALTDRLDPRGSVLQAVLHGERSWGDLTAGEVGSAAKMVEDGTLKELVSQGMKSLARDLARYPDLPLGDVVGVEERAGLDEDRVAGRLKISHDLLAAASWQLWKRTFAEERDRRAGPEANAQKRGRVSRELQRELTEELARGDDQ